MTPSGPRLGVAVVALLLLSAPGSELRAQGTGTPCDRLTALTIPDTRITGAAEVPAGPFVPPGEKSGPTLPAFCRVEGMSTPTPDSAIRFEVWMPPQGAWNGKLQAVGTTGFLGAIDYGAMSEALLRGYAAAGTDAGHVGGDLRFAEGHPEKIVDFSYRAIHLTAEVAKLVIRNHEGRAPDFSYFNGCNTGGHQGMSEAQRFPHDFDGIIAGMPANDRINEIAAYLYVWQVSHPDGKNLLPAASLHTLGQAVMKACDGLDGVTDGVIDNPPACRFDPKVLTCSGGDTTACLTAAQVAAVEKIYAGLRHPRTGEQIFPGWPFGSESTGPSATQGQGWRQIIDLPAPRRSEFWNYFVFNDPNWDWRTMDFDRDLAYAYTKVGYVSAIDFDLTPFKNAGGKLLMYSGWADPILPGGDPVHQYEEITHAAGGADATMSFARLFMMPGVGHCSGGPGPDLFDPVTALEQWVEAGKAPARLIAKKAMDGKTVRTRPLCAYPDVATWSGTGSTDDAANFTCRKP
jgi:feruloyl esterase